jgi:hypothetical protein
MRSVLDEPMPGDYYDYLMGFVEGRGPPQEGGGGGSGGSRSWGGAAQQRAAGVELAEPLAVAKAWHLDQLGCVGVYDMDAGGPLVARQRG